MRLPQDFLHSVGVSEISYQGRPAAPHPLLDPRVRNRGSVRTSLDGADRFRGSAAANYTIRTLAPRAAPAMAYVVPSKASRTAKPCGFTTNPPGLPGAASWQEEWADCLSAFHSSTSSSNPTTVAKACFGRSRLSDRRPPAARGLVGGEDRARSTSLSDRSASGGPRR